MQNETILFLEPRTRAAQEHIGQYGNEWRVIGEEVEEGKDVYVIENVKKCKKVGEEEFEFTIPKVNGTHFRIAKINNQIQKDRVEESTVEAIFADLCYWEDMNTALMIIPTENGGIQVINYNGNREAQGDTLKEALINFGRSIPYISEEPDEYELNWGV